MPKEQMSRFLTNLAETGVNSSQQAGAYIAEAFIIAGRQTDHSVELGMWEMATSLIERVQASHNRFQVSQEIADCLAGAIERTARIEVR